MTTRPTRPPSGPVQDGDDRLAIAIEDHMARSLAGGAIPRDRLRLRPPRSMSDEPRIDPDSDIRERIAAVRRRRVGRADIASARHSTVPAVRRRFWRLVARLREELTAEDETD